MNKPVFRLLTDLRLQTKRTDIFPDWCAYFFFFNIFWNTQVPSLLRSALDAELQHPAGCEPTFQSSGLSSELCGRPPLFSQWHVFIPVKYGESCRHRPICCCCCC